MNFDQLNLSENMQRALGKMGFKEPMPVQEKTIAPMLEGHDLLVQSPTGSGKTCAFGIPIIEAIDTSCREVQALILCPTRELAMQTTAVLQQLSLYSQSLKISTLYGGEPIGKQMASMRRKPQIVVATPGRLMDLIERRCVKLHKVNTLVMDEADRMLDMGFRPDMDSILRFVPGERQTVLFSATLTQEVLVIAREYQHNAWNVKIGDEIRTVESIRQYYVLVRKGAKELAIEALLREYHDQQTLIFVGTKSMADTLAEQMKAQGIEAEALHGGMRQLQRDKVMKRYRSGDINVLIATDVAARGIDVHNITVVINYDIPGSSTDYVHRIGRTGRANSDGLAFTLVYDKDRAQLRQIMQDTHAHIKALSLPGVPSTRGETKPQAADRRQARPDRKGGKPKAPAGPANKSSAKGAPHPAKSGSAKNAPRPANKNSTKNAPRPAKTANYPAQKNGDPVRRTKPSSAKNGARKASAK